MTNRVPVNITGNKNIVMQYLNYKRDIVQKYHVKMIGWTHEKWANVSELGNSLEPLETLWNALQEGKCKFVQILATEANARAASVWNAIATGQAAPPTKRKARKDKGVAKGPRKRSGKKSADAPVEQGEGSETESDAFRESYVEGEERTSMRTKRA